MSLAVSTADVIGLMRGPQPVVLEVLGSPAPKGSARAFVVNGRAVLAPGGSATNRRNLKGWDAAVRDAARAAIGFRTSPVFVGAALAVTVSFRLNRPAGHWGKRGLKPSAPPFPATKPDIDKLVRATIDPLTGVVFDDDSRIVRLVAEKDYAAPGNEGATITIEAMAS